MTLQRTVAQCNTLQHTVKTLQDHVKALQDAATHCNMLQHATTHCNTLQHTARHCNTLRQSATYCNTLQRTATHCTTLQITATRTYCSTHRDSIRHVLCWFGKCCMFSEGQHAPRVPTNYNTWQVLYVFGGATHSSLLKIQILKITKQHQKTPHGGAASCNVRMGLLQLNARHCNTPHCNTLQPPPQ